MIFLRFGRELTWWAWGFGLIAQWWHRGEATSEWARELRFCLRLGPWLGWAGILIPKTLWARMGER